VHGDYSTFNILWHNERAIVIDFPQVIEFKNNPNAKALLERDVHLCVNPSGSRALMPTK
jgi:RIO kinase 1